MNLPNSLTVTRIFLVPLLVVVLLTKFEGRHDSRRAEGARRRGDLRRSPRSPTGSTATSRAAASRSRRSGRCIDPLADKLLTSAALISLVQMELAPAWMVAIIIGREFAVTGLRSLAYARGVAMPASPLGKIKMVAQVVAILALILGDGYAPDLLVVGRAALWVVVATALVSGADYFRRFGLFPGAKVTDISVAREQRATDRKAG